MSSTVKVGERLIISGDFNFGKQGSLWLFDGTAAAPPLSFRSHKDTGMYLDGSSVSFTTGGAKVFEIGPSGVVSTVSVAAPALSTSSLSIAGLATFSTVNVTNQMTVAGLANITSLKVENGSANILTTNDLIALSDANVTGQLTTATLTTSGLATLASANVTGQLTTATLTTSGLATLASANVAGQLTTATLTTSGLATLASANVTGRIICDTLTSNSLVTLASADVVWQLSAGNFTSSGLVTFPSANCSGTITTGTLNTSGLATLGSANVAGVVSAGSLVTSGSANIAGALLPQSQMLYSATTLTSSTTLDPSASIGNKIIIAIQSDTATTQTLPSSSNNTGIYYLFINIGNGAATINTSNSNYFNGDSTFTSFELSKNDTLSVVAFNSNWYTI